jgi:16S rRNA (adenine1518-N6/adenine1519-N6)-dimethyltransferase
MMHRPRKRFGQHFLHDPAIIRRIVETIGVGPGDRIVEIGPGLGAITRPLLQATGSLDAVELDRDVIPRLRAACAGLGDLRIHEADALKFDFCSLAPDSDKLRIVGNLPYNVSTPLLFRLLAQRRCITDMHFILQREVVDRIAARPGNKQYGRLTVMLAIYCEAEPLFRIGPGAFNPPPRVESAFLRLTPRMVPEVAPDDPMRFADLVRQAFSFRRKTLRNAVAGYATPAELEQLGIDPRNRPEQLAPNDFVRIANLGARGTDQAGFTGR